MFHVIMGVCSEHTPVAFSVAFRIGFFRARRAAGTRQQDRGRGSAACKRPGTRPAGKSGERGKIRGAVKGIGKPHKGTEAAQFAPQYDGRVFGTDAHCFFRLSSGLAFSGHTAPPEQGNKTEGAVPQRVSVRELVRPANPGSGGKIRGSVKEIGKPCTEKDGIHRGKTVVKPPGGKAGIRKLRRYRRDLG